MLREFLDTSAADPRALVLEGHAGIGKSTLWLGAVDAARQRGRRVLITRPTEAEQGLAFAGLGDILESVADEVLASLLPPRRAALEAALLLGEARTDVHPRAVGVAVRDALALVAADHSLVVAIDDVQWLDESSSSALTFALRRLGGSAQFLLARRIEEGVDDSELEHAFAPDRIERVRLGPLSLGATQVLLDARLDRVFTRPVLQRIHTIAGGNPLYAIEVARIIGSGIDPTQPLPVPDSLDGLMAARLAGLPEESRSGLDLIAAAGDISWNRLRVAAVDPNGLQPALDAQVLESQGMTVRFAHPLLAAAYYQRLSPTRRQDAHRVVSNLVDDPVDRARHLALATDQPDADLASALDDGVQAATARGAIASAVELGEHALRLTPPGDAGQIGRRTTALARAHLAHATVDRAEELLRALLDHEGPGTRRAEALLALRDVGSDRDDPIALLREALEEADGDRTLQARIHTRLGWDLRFIGERVAAESHAAAALALAEQLDDAGLLAAALATFAGARHHNGEPDAFELADRACSMIADLTDTAVRIDVAGLLVTTFVWTGHHDRLPRSVRAALPRVGRTRRVATGKRAVESRARRARGRSLHTRRRSGQAFVRDLPAVRQR